MVDYGIIGRMMARWIRTGRLGPPGFEATCARLAVAQPRHAPPILLWGEEEESYPFALIAPLRFAPGKRLRWAAWGLGSAVATYRQFGVHAYLNNDELWLHGRRVAETSVEVVGECAAIRSRFLMSFPSSCVPTPSRELEQAFRLRLEAQHGWQFEHSWPSGAELPALAAA
jgi:hypothetical protein